MGPKGGGMSAWTRWGELDAEPALARGAEEMGAVMTSMMPFRGMEPGRTTTGVMLGPARLNAANRPSRTLEILVAGVPFTGFVVALGAISGGFAGQGKRRGDVVVGVGGDGEDDGRSRRREWLEGIGGHLHAHIGERERRLSGGLEIGCRLDWAEEELGVVQGRGGLQSHPSSAGRPTGEGIANQGQSVKSYLG